MIASIYQQFVDKKDRKNVEFESFLPFPDAYGYSEDIKKVNNKSALTIKSKRILQKLLKAGKLGSHLYGMLAPYWNMTDKSEGVT